jgi:hypothetical protein
MRRKFFLHGFCGFFPTLRLKSGFLSNGTSLAAASSTVATRKPLTPSSIWQRIPPGLPPMTAAPFHIASVTARPKPSRIDFFKTTAARDIFSRVLTEVVGNYAEYAKRVWKEIVKKFFIEEVMINPVVSLSFSDNWVEFTGRFITDYRRRRDTKDKIFSRLLEEIDKTEGRVGIATASFELENPPPLEVHLTGQ